MAGVDVEPKLAPEVSSNRAIIVWSQLFGQFRGSVDPADEFFAHAIGQMADFIGLP
ncbi:hypothetical protein [Actinosynnema sp. ALI-1.44]|uniref:hypothetical protein n=1 Tax=Actinosynnema sp. ALI-1.44 TaxID=1933779 RepID=UPI001EDBD5C3|nr:hypothetical protein [Actinosynnema sp. ALI-1.44]